MAKVRIAKSNKLRNNIEQQDKKRRRLILIFSLFMVGLMLFSIMEVALFRDTSSQTNQMKYGTYEFVYKDLGNGAGYLATDINGQEVQFQNLPTQVTYLNLSPAAIAVLKAAPVVVLTTDMNQTYANLNNIEYARLQFSLALQKTTNAMLYEDERYTLPIINCSRSSSQMAVVVFNTANETSVITDGSCITINAAQRDLMKIKDRFIFEYYGILNDGVVTPEISSNWFKKLFN